MPTAIALGLRLRHQSLSSDFDIGYAVLVSKEFKDVVMPDSVAKKYRDYHFERDGAG